MTPAPAVTVIVATYNWSSVLPFSIGSVLMQEFADFELLVVGDGCTDDSAAVVAAVADPRVRWIDLPANSGHQSAPNNEGLRQARGALVAYLGHDDLWLPHHLACLVAALADGAALAHSITAMIAPEQERSWLALRTGYRPGDWMPPSNVVHRRDAALRAGGWRDYRELDVDPEVELWRRIHAGGGRLAFVPRLTTIKFPAALRRDVYRERPCHEQAAWLARIQDEPDLEAVELARHLLPALHTLDEQAHAPPPRDPTYGELARTAARITAKKVKRRLRPASPPPVPEVHGAAIARRRRFKGITEP